MADAATLLQALRLRPDDAGLACGLADVLANEGKLTKAILLYRHALEQAPTLARACYGAGCAENMRQDFAAAREWFAQAVELSPSWLEARHNLARALYELGQVSEAFAHFQECGTNPQSRAMLAVVIPGVPEASHADILSARQSWAARDDMHAQRRPRHAPLRIAYVSSFFQRDNWMKPVWGLINQHDRQAFQVHLFSDCPRAAVQHGYESQPTDQFLDTSKLSNDELAAQFENCGIDIVIDLNGYSNMRRAPVFTRRLTPVVIGWFNHYATTGLAGFDYLIGDTSVIPPDEEPFYSEKILRVTGSYLTFDVRYPVPPIERSLLPDGFVFGALASQYKITPQVMDAWSRILLRAPDSSLLIKNQRLESGACRKFVLNEFQTRGVPPSRIYLEGPEPHYGFLKAYSRIDLALDTFPYNGGTTTSEALWQGVPVLTFYGDRWASRTSASILTAAGLSRFVAKDLDEYIDLAVHYASHSTGRKRDGMREYLTATNICNTRAFASEIEQIYKYVAR